MKNVELGDLKDGGVQIKPFIHCYCSMLENLMISPSCSLSHRPDRPKGLLFVFFMEHYVMMRKSEQISHLCDMVKQ